MNLLGILRDYTPSIINCKFIISAFHVPHLTDVSATALFSPSAMLALFRPLRLLRSEGVAQPALFTLPTVQLARAATQHRRGSAEGRVDKSKEDGLFMVNDNFFFYLSGLIEGAGTILVPKSERSNKGKLYYPSIQISFDSRDFPLALIIQKNLGFGSISKTKGVNSYRLTINNYDDLIYIVKALNGKLRTVKINDFYLLIDFLNKRFPELSIVKKELDNSSFKNNA